MTLVGDIPRHIAGVDVPLLILMRCRFNKDRHWLTLIDKVAGIIRSDAC